MSGAFGDFTFGITPFGGSAQSIPIPAKPRLGTDVFDIQHLYGDDVAVSATGDLAVVGGEDRTQLRIIRRLLTSSTVKGNSAYPWEPDYGAGLGERIGETLDLRLIAAIVMSQVILEPSVAKVPIPGIVVTALNGGSGAQIDIAYTTLSGVQETFNFNLTAPSAVPATPSVAVWDKSVWDGPDVFDT